MLKALCLIYIHMKILLFIKDLYNHKINMGLARVFQLVLGLIVIAIIFTYYNYQDSKIDYESEVKVSLLVSHVVTFKNEDGRLTGYRFKLLDNQFPERIIEYPVIGEIKPLPKKGDSLPFSRLDVEGGKHKYIFMRDYWKQKNLGI